MSYNSVLNLIEKKVEDLGGKITNRFKIIKGFSMELSDEYINTFNDQVNKLSDLVGYKINVEEDQTMHAY
ncbi:hypothetical protein NCAS_0B07230 [Naumovozyma castellii]|uniref:Inhibitor I9 domain-containing protein n=1 Tax=Naumovozyma castellii TaxID=27288 RepID=G0VA77_NAUCA|nr:hypothetical protein NCAS_0B07230 [Naumovozyma castellii CBS 4309]CCC68807.1 hypothetical protein NCAS_0B07230 [Naumovozyma castellii CBS 4309]